MIFNPLALRKAPASSFAACVATWRVVVRQGALSSVGARRFHCDRFFLKLIKLLMLLTLNKNHTILQMSGRVDSFYEGLGFRRNKGRCSHFKVSSFSCGGGEGKFKLKLNWPFPIEAAGILLNETPSLHGCWFVAYSFFFVSSPLALFRRMTMFCGGLFFFGCDW